jgi:hypothetical protein
MKHVKILFLGMLLPLSMAFSNQNLSNFDGKIITDEMAKELGMTEMETTKGQGFFQKLGNLFFREDKALEKSLVPDPLKAEVVAIINKSKEGTASSAQTLKLYYKGDLLHTFKVSTGKEVKVTATSGKVYVASTPIGYFRPTTIWKEYQSSLWVGASMHNPVFFINGIAIHATTEANYPVLGNRASGGCVRLHPDHAKIFNELVLSTGLDSYRIVSKNLTVNGTKIVRNQVVGGDISIPAVERASGNILTKKKVQSWDSLIIVKEIKD